MSGRGAAGLSALWGLRGDELQSARDRGELLARQRARSDTLPLAAEKAAPLESVSQVRQEWCR